MKKIACFIVVCLFFLCRHGYAYWVWSPQTNKWVNPVYRTFDTPEEQFNWAKKYFDDGDYRKAISEFKKVLKKFKESAFAPEAKYYLGLCYEKLGKLYPAFETYQSVIDIYPLNDRLEEIVERQYIIGEKFFTKRKYDLAKDIFAKVLENAPYSKVSDVAQYKVALCYLKMRDYVNARDELSSLMENYGYSPYLDDASFHIGFCSFKISSSVKDYDEELVDKAIDDLEYFLRRFQTSDYVPKAQSLLDKLKHRKAERLFVVAQFYEKQRKTYAAIKYYEEVVFSYEKTDWAKQARARLKRLREK